jgi:CTP synthase
MNLPNENYMTNGMIFKHVIDKERSLGYKGQCVEPVYHITEEILRRFKSSIKKTDAEITIVEIGGTVGEYQNAIFLEAARVLKQKNPSDVMFVMVSYLPVPKIIGEMKTKPTQNAVRQLNSYGINPDIIIARSEVPLDKKRKEKISIATGVDTADVISAPDIHSIYEIPVNFENDGLSQRILSHFNIKPKKKDLVEWRAMIKNIQNPKQTIRIAVVGKYFDTGDFVISDVYISVIEAIKFSGFAEGASVDLTWINSKDIESGKVKIEELSKFDGILVPGGFGSNGIEGIIDTIKYAREKKIPYFGLCYGMQLLVIEYARNVIGLKDANTREIASDTKHIVIDVMEDQKENIKNNILGGSMRLGAYPAKIKKGTVAYEAYKKDLILERHRHRYEVNNYYKEQFENFGLVFSGMSPDNKLCEIAELSKKDHPFFLGTQFHPEFQARPLHPHPLFTSFLKACIKNKK